VSENVIATRTEYGFKYGAADVECLASDLKRGWVAIGVKTPKMNLQIYVTKTGKTRLYVNGLEMVSSK
jgi:hypothetical protein